MTDKIIKDTLSFLKDEGIYIFIKTKDKTYGEEKEGLPLYSIANEDYSLKVFAEVVNIDDVFPIITFLDSVLSPKNKDIHTDFNNKIIEFFSLLSHFESKLDGFKKVSNSIKKVLNLKDVIILEKINDRLIGINSYGKNINENIRNNTGESLTIQKDSGVYLNKNSKLKSMIVKDSDYLYIEPLKGSEKTIGIIMFESYNPISIANINILKQLTGLAATFIEINIFREDMSKLMENSLNVMIDALDSRTKGGKNHTKRVMEISLQFGKYLKLSSEELEIVKIGTLLHDIGKIGVSDTILNKDGPLNEDEIKMVRLHPIFGKEIVDKISGIKAPVKDIIMYHHERWDGKGYPENLSKEKIPYLARMVVLSDIYEALTSERSYRKAYDKEWVIDYIGKNKGKIFDPELADKFVDFIGGNNY